MDKVVVMIEDDPVLRSAYQTILTREGFDVVAARDGLEGMKLAETTDPDLVLLDLLMPNFDGMEFLRQFDHTKHPKAKIVVFSNMGDPKQEKAALELGATNYLVKSEFSPKELVDFIQKLLSEPANE
jgi:DNA-binding response OmpR family regulator